VADVTRADARRPGRPAHFLIGTAGLYGADMALSVVLTWSVLALSHSPLLAAVALILNSLPQVITGIVGPARMGVGEHPSRLLFVCGGGLLAMGVLALVVRGTAPLVDLLLLAAVVEGLGNAAVIPVAQAWWMGLTPPGEKVRAARDYEIASRIPRILAPVVGSLLLAAGRLGPALAVIGLGFLLAAWNWRGRVTVEDGALRALAWSEGLRALGHDRWLLAALALRGLSNVLWPAYSIGLPWLVLTRFHQSPFTYGLVTTMYGLSTIALAWPAGRMATRILRRWYMAAWGLTGAGFVALGLSGDVLAVFLAVLLVGLGSPMIHMGLDAHIGAEIPQQRQASVFAFQRFVMGIAGLVGLYAVGWLLTSLSTDIVLMVTGAAIVVSAAAAAAIAEPHIGSSARPA
jgi:MFS family permease